MLHTGNDLQYFLISFFAMLILFAFFMFSGAAFKIFAAFLENDSLAAVVFAS